MPKKLINDYIFYKIVCISGDIDLCYVGSTANWKERQRTHKSDCNNENNKSYNNKKYEIIRANGGWENFKMVQLGTREQLTKREAEQIEEEYRQELKANMNSRLCYVNNKNERNKEVNKKYYDNNVDKRRESCNEWRSNNKDKILEYQKNYYDDNKEQIRTKAKELIKCECGCEVVRFTITRHKRSQRHINLMLNN